MIITRTPLRISFVGGGSDLPVFYREEEGAVLSAAIRRYVYITANPKFDDRIRVSYSITENVDRIDKLRHDLVRESLRRTGIVSGIEITSVSDVPSAGTGLGASGAYTVGLLHALWRYRGRPVRRPDLAAEACDVEMVGCGRIVGKQDPYAAALGRIRVYRFEPDGGVRARTVPVGRDALAEFGSRLLLVHLGDRGSAAALLARQTDDLRSNREKRLLTRRLVTLVPAFESALMRSAWDEAGEILHESWMVKRGLADGISTPGIDDLYARCRRAGALGGKVVGAGGRGFMLLLIRRESRPAVEAALEGLRRLPVEFDLRGTCVVHDDGRRRGDAGDQAEDVESALPAALTA